MSNSSLVSYVHLSPHYRERTGKISKITIHHAATVKASLKGLGNGFSGSRVASSNYGIDNDGNIALYVEECHRAITSSSTSNDNVAVTIEVANSAGAPNWPVSDKALAALVELCVDICRRNNIEELDYTGTSAGNLTRHNMFANTTCPGPYLQGKFSWIEAEVNKRLKNNTPAPVPQPTPNKHTTVRKGSAGAQVKELQEKLNYIGFSLATDGSYGAKTESAVKDFQGNNGLNPDGVCGPKTWNKVEEVYAFAHSYNLKAFIREVQAAIGAEVDGTPGNETINKTVTVSKTINRTHPVVKAIQKRLFAMGYTIVGSADGKAGSKFDKAVKELQKDCGNYVDGEITRAQKTWRVLLGLA